ncbi:Type II secretion system protein F [BD1-7 clade bacterium]|uniref:Type II secretion system protein F n=1 Tax=BD1-7 clade bacterium TaxID=2029982 RepID=A0A5S9Q9N3_9GAMM|nr:Type II secretion system protein F [BD1-7 clade bacterium]CAA0115682.1 Type II secretion system protein F [BD1-7 clade bacterium]
MATAKAKQKTKSFTFAWTGMNAKGEKVSGELDGASSAIIKVQLKKQGIVPKRVVKKSKPLFGGGNKAIKPGDIAIFTRQLATMLKAGVPLIQSFDIVAEGLENKSMAELCVKIRNEVAGGASLAGALANYPRYFDDLFVNLVDSGEQAGALETMLERVATYKEKSEALKSKIKKAMKYPITVLAVAGVVTGILLIKVVPQFAELFEGFGSELPAFTQMVMNLSEWVQAYWFIILVSIIAIVLAHREGRVRSQAYSDRVDAVSLKLPIVGKIVTESVYARFARTLSTTFAAGVPLVDALESVRGAAGNAVYSKALKKVKDDVSTGIPLNVCIRASNVFPSMMIQMIAIGEESGDLDGMLSKLADHYETEVDDSVDSLTSLMEPLIMAVLGVLVGGLMVAMYLPIFMMGQAI